MPNYELAFVSYEEGSTSCRVEFEEIRFSL